jgi:hypothetical protein
MFKVILLAMTPMVSRFVLSPWRRVKVIFPEVVGFQVML